MAKRFEINNKRLMWVIAILFVMSMMPGEGTKAADQQAIVDSTYTCSVDEDCPVCVGAGLVDYNETDPGFLGELSYSECSGGTCQLSDACLVWDCGEAGDCDSIKQTLLDNTIGRFNDNPTGLIILIGLIIAFLMLK